MTSKRPDEWWAYFSDYKDLTQGYIVTENKRPSLISNNSAEFNVVSKDKVLKRDIQIRDLTKDLLETKEKLYGDAERLIMAYGEINALKASIRESHMAMVHALYLGYVGEGSTNGMFKAVIKAIEKVMPELKENSYDE